MLSRKHKDAEKVRYKSGFFITTNRKPKFGKKRTTQQESDTSSDSDSDSDMETSTTEMNEVNSVRKKKDPDNEAVYKRLRCFKTKPLPNQNSAVSSKYIFSP